MARARALMDTNVISYIIKKDPIAVPYRKYLRKRTLCVSFMTIAELTVWLRIGHKGRKKKELIDYLESAFVRIESSPAICDKWADLYLLQRRTGRIISFADTWIAATALVYKLPLITHNKKDFEWIPGLKVISE